MIHTTYDNDESLNHPQSPDNEGRTMVRAATAGARERHPSTSPATLGDGPAVNRRCVVVPVAGKD